VSDAGSIFGAATVAVGVGFSVPQLVRLTRGHAAGVSPSALTNSAISFLAWTLYAAWIRDVWLLASSAVGLPGAAATAVVAVRADGDRSWLRLPGLWVLTLLAATFAECTGTTSVLPLVIGTSVLWCVAPALLRAWRSADVSGIAVGSWLVLAGEGALFLGYGWQQQLVAPSVYGVVCLAGAGGVLARLGMRRRRPPGIVRA
jgi:uncharacterized protein with PQ loop repeat